MGYIKEKDLTKHVCQLGNSSLQTGILPGFVTVTLFGQNLHASWHKVITINPPNASLVLGQTVCVVRFTGVSVHEMPFYQGVFTCNHCKFACAS